MDIREPCGAARRSVNRLGLMVDPTPRGECDPTLGETAGLRTYQELCSELLGYAEQLVDFAFQLPT